jgi:hypothetical protein
LRQHSSVKPARDQAEKARRFDAGTADGETVDPKQAFTRK